MDGSTHTSVVSAQKHVHVAELALAAMMRDPLLLKQLIMTMAGTSEPMPLSATLINDLQPYMVGGGLYHIVCADMNTTTAATGCI